MKRELIYVQITTFFYLRKKDVDNKNTLAGDKLKCQNKLKIKM